MFIYIILAVMEVPKELPTIEVTVPPGVIGMYNSIHEFRGFEDVFNDDFSISTLMELYRKMETKTNKKSTIFFENDFEELLV